MDTTINASSAISISGAMKPGFESILTTEAVSFIADLERRFGAERRRLLEDRQDRQKQLDAGKKPTFLAETKQIRDRNWKIAPLPDDLKDRRVEITGPVDRKMIINALNSGAKLFMADFEDSNTPSWTNQIEGQINLKDAVRRTITFDDPASGKHYALNKDVAVLKVRPRGWHLEEKHVTIDGQPMSGSLFDFGLYAFHNAEELLSRGSGPYFYLPKMESYREARLWNEVFNHTELTLGIKRGSIKATCLIETILAAFEMDEILYELKEHSAGLNCGRWDYIFSFIKKFQGDKAAILPDRATVTMTSHFLRSYSLLAIKTCHRRGAPAIGGMAALIPIKDDPAANEKAMNAVKADKERESSDGHDGTWVAHPGLVPLAREIFDRNMPEPNQIGRLREDVNITAADLVVIPPGEITETGLRTNVAVAIGYLEAWLRGIGCVPLFNLMEDAATAEISRAQLWQWERYAVTLADGRTVDKALVDATIEEELGKWSERVGVERYKSGRFADAAKMLRTLVHGETFVEFLTLPAYDALIAEGA
jgi:malate synthase